MIPEVNAALSAFLLPFVSAIVGGIVVHFLSLSRERAAKRRDLVTKHLIEIWQAIESTNKQIEENPLKRLEKAFADIQLFGSDTSIALAKKAADDVVANNTADTTVLLNQLRDSLRSELGLKPTKHGFFWFRSAPQKFAHTIKSDSKQ